MRREFQLDKDRLAFIIKACEPPLNGETFTERVNGAWDVLGKHMGFDGRTCEPVSGKGMEFFTAEEK